MESLQIEDKVNLVKFYFLNGESVTTAIRAFCTMKGIKKKENAPNYKTVERMIENFKQTGNVNISRTSSKRRSSQDIEQVQELIETKPTSSCRSIAASLENSISKTKVHSILKEDLNLKAFKMQQYRLLSENAMEERKEFCTKFIEKSDDVSFLDNILFTDESMFDLNPIENKQNCRIWDKNKPLPAVFKKTDFPQKQMVWIGFTKNFVIGPYFFETTVCSDTYCEMLNDFVIPQLKARRKLSSTIFQQDGARPHTAKQTLDLLNSKFPGRVISRGTPFSWPAYSPDLSPVDFAFWGFLKGKIHGKNYLSMDDLKRSVTAAVQEMPQDFFHSSVNSVIERCRLCLQNEGDVFEK